MEIKKPKISYTSRDFQSIKNDLVNYAKVYYPETYKDFNEASFGSLMFDLVSYVGDILSFYVDYQSNESFLETAIEPDNVLKLANQMGYRLGAYRPVKPEDVITKDTPFDNIIRESSKYTQASYERISPASLLNLVRVLDNYSKYELQWLRAATAVEIIYKYMSNGASREQFFKSTAKFTEESLLELEEFFKTDHLFMTLDELHEFKKDLEFYRGDKNKELLAKAKKLAGANNKKNNNLVI
jgi:hypothetical protein